MDGRRYFTTNPVRYFQATSVLTVLFLIFVAASPRTPIEARIFAGVVLVPWMWSLVRTFRLGVYSSPRELRIENLFRTYRLEWDEIRGVAIGTTQWNGIAAIVECTDGRRIHCSAVQHPWMSTVDRAYNEKCGEIVKQLRGDLQRFSNRPARRQETGPD